MAVAPSWLPPELEVPNSLIDPFVSENYVEAYVTIVTNFGFEHELGFRLVMCRNQTGGFYHKIRLCQRKGEYRHPHHMLRDLPRYEPLPRMEHIKTWYGYPCLDGYAISVVNHLVQAKKYFLAIAEIANALVYINPAEATRGYRHLRYCFSCRKIEHPLHPIDWLECPQCGETICSECTHTIKTTSGEVECCGYCQGHYRSCGHWSQSAARCNRCRKLICPSCANTCKNCNATYCKECEKTHHFTFGPKNRWCSHCHPAKLGCGHKASLDCVCERCGRENCQACDEYCDVCGKHMCKNRSIMKCTCGSFTCMECLKGGNNQEVKGCCKKRYIEKGFWKTACRPRREDHSVRAGVEAS